MSWWRSPNPVWQGWERPSALISFGAVALSALFFAIIHLDPLQGLIAFFIGLYLGYLVVRSGSIYPEG